MQRGHAVRGKVNIASYNRDSREDAGHVEDFRVQISQVAHDEDENGLDNTNVIGEARDETSKEAPDDADQGATDGHNKEGGETG